MAKRIFTFKQFVNESYKLDEGIFTWLKQNVLDKITGWASDFYNMLKSGLIRTAPSGPLKGKPVQMLFLRENGSIEDQVKKFYGESYIEEAVVPLEYTGSDQSVRNIAADDLKKSIIKLYRSKERGGRAKPIFIYGAPGIGKTQIVAQAADELGVDLVFLDLQFMNPEDFLGIPKQIDIEEPKFDDGKVVSGGKGFTRSNPPLLLPRDNRPHGKGGIIFMDEMNRSNKVVLSSVMQFVQQGRIGEYNLPDKWVIVSAGNRPEEADVAEFDFALADRFIILNYVPTIEGWAEWARKNGKIFPELVTFLMHNKDLFHQLDVEKEVKNFPSPRSWSDSALQIYDEVQDEGVNSWRDLPDSTIANIFYDNVGPFAAGKISDYLKILKRISDQEMEMIKNDAENAPMVDSALKEKSVLYGLSSMVLSSVDQYSTESLYNIMKYFNRYNQLELLSWIYKSILNKFPQFKFGGTTTTEDDKMRLEAANMVVSSAKSKGL